MRVFLFVIISFFSSQLCAEEIKMTCNGTLYKYSSNFLGNKNITVRENAEWLGWCDSTGRSKCRVTTSERGGKMEWKTDFDYTGSPYLNENLKIGVKYRVTATTILDFETKNKTIKGEFESIKPISLRHNHVENEETRCRVQK